MNKIILIFFAVVISVSASAGTCTDNSVPSGRVFVDKISRLQVDGDGWTIFKYVVGSQESGWITFNSSNDIGKQYLSLLLAAGSTASKISFYVTEGVCNGGALDVGKFSVQWF